MTTAVPRFCPRCGAAQAGDLPFCPSCGLNVAALGEGGQPGPVPGSESSLTERLEREGSLPERPSGTGLITQPVRPAPVRAAETTRESRRRGVPAVVVAGALVMIGLLGYGLLTRPSGTPGGGTPIGPGATPTPTVAAPIVGLTILSPTDGQAVATKEVTVIGTAPPGLTVTQDISFGLDQHTGVDGTGHWAIKVELKDGENRLVFRIGDDASTRKTVRVIYTPPASP